MPITNITATNTSTITIGAAGNDRIVVALLAQNRTPVAIQNVQFNGVAGNLALFEEGTTGYGTAIYYWLEADLPASAGSYSLTHSFLVDKSLVYAEGVAQTGTVTDTANLADFVTGSGAGASTERKTDLTLASAGALCVATTYQIGSSDGVITGCTESAYDVNAVACYTTTQTEVGVLSSFALNSANAASFAPSAPSYTITSIDGDNNVQAGQSNVSIVTSGIDPASVTQAVTLGGETLTINSWTDSGGNALINVDIPLHINLKWDTTHQLAVTHDGGTTTLDGVTLSTPTGWETVTYSGSLPAGDSFASLAATDATLGGGGYTMQAGDILAWETQTGLTVDVNTTPVVDPAATVSGSYKIWNEVGQTWTSVSTFTINDLGLNVGSTIPVEDRVTFQAMVGYLITQGYQGAGNETIQKWLIAEGISKKPFNEMLRDYLTGLGYNGTLPEQLRDWRNG